MDLWDVAFEVKSDKGLVDEVFEVEDHGDVGFDGTRLFGVLKTTKFGEFLDTCAHALLPRPAGR